MATSTASVTTDTTNYTRIHLILMKGGTLLTKTLFLKRVKDLSPAGHELTVDEFLGKDSVKNEVLSKKTGRNNKEKLYPPNGSFTNLDEWDLPLYCFILKVVCGLPNINKLDMEILKTMRNELSHLHDPSLTDADFKSRLSMIEPIFTRSLQIINDPLFEGEITNLVQRYKTGALSVDEIVKIHHKHIELLGNQLKMMENKLDTVLKNQNNQDTQLATALSMLKKIDDKLPPGSDVDIQDVHVIIEVKNCTRDKEQELLEFLVKQFNETISKPECNLTKDFPNLAMHTISEAICKTLKDFLANGRHVLKVENGSISLTVKCKSISSFVDLISDSLDGSLLYQLGSLKDALRSWDGCGGVDLEPTISPDEITSAILKLAKDLEKKLQGEDLNVGQLLPMEQQLAERDGSSNAQATSPLCLTGSSLKLTIKPDTKEQRKEIESNFIGSFTEGFEQFQNELRKDPDFRNVVIETKLLASDNFSKHSENSQESMVFVTQQLLNRNLRTNSDESTLLRQREETLTTDDKRSESDLPGNEGSQLLYRKEEKGNARRQGSSITPGIHREQERKTSGLNKFTPDWSREDLGITDTEVLFVDKNREKSAVKGEKDEKCPLCYDALKTECLLKCSCCKKDFHDRCMTVWLTKNQNCPLCSQTWNSNYKETHGKATMESSNDRCLEDKDRENIEDNSHHATVHDKNTGEVFGIVNKHVALNADSDVSIRSNRRGKIHLGEFVKSFDKTGMDIGLVKIYKKQKQITRNQITRDVFSTVCFHDQGLEYLFNTEFEKYRPANSEYEVCSTDTSNLGKIASDVEHSDVLGTSDQSGQVLVKTVNGTLFATPGESGTAIALRRKSSKESWTLIGILCGGTKEYCVCLYLASVIGYLNEYYQKDLELCDCSPLVLEDIGDFMIVNECIPCGIQIFIMCKTPEQIAPYNFDLVDRTLYLICCTYDAVDERQLKEIMEMKKVLSDKVNDRNCSVFENDKPEYVATERGMLACDFLYNEDPKSAEEHLKIATDCIPKSHDLGLRLLCKHVTYVTWFCLEVNSEKSLKEMEILLETAIEVFQEFKELLGFPTESLGCLYYDFSRYYIKKYDTARKLPQHLRNKDYEHSLRRCAIEKAMLAKDLFEYMHKKINTSSTRSRMILADCQAAFSILGCGETFNVLEGEINETELKNAECIVDCVKQELIDVPLVQKTDFLIACCDLYFRKGQITKALKLAQICLRDSKRKQYPLGIRESINRINYFSKKRQFEIYSTKIKSIHFPILNFVKYENENSKFYMCTHMLFCYHC